MSKGHLYQRDNSRCWWISYYRNGKQFQESSKSEKRSDAQKLLNKRLGEIATGTFHGLKHEKVTFDDLAADFLNDYRINARRSVDKAERSVKHLAQYFGGMRAMNITTDKIKTYIRQWQEAGLSNCSINRELAALKRMFSLATRQSPPKVQHAPYIPMLQEEGPRQGFFEREHYEALLTALPDYLRPVITFGYTYGWRKSEVLGLTWDRVDLNARVVRVDVGVTKGGEGRLIFLTDELQTLLTAMRKAQPFMPYVFTRDGRPIKDFKTAWWSACEASGLEGKTFHDFRRTAVRNLIRAGVPERVAMQITGHKTRSVFERYNIVSESDRSEASRRLQAHHERLAEGGAL